MASRPALTVRVSLQVSSSRMSAPPSIKPFGLVIEAVDKFRESDAATDRNGFGSGPHGARHESHAAGS